jgi:DNA ligase-1
LKQLQKRGALSAFVKVIDVVKCEGKEHLESYFKGILAKGGEGVMLRQPGSLYKVGRATSLRKYKPFLDAEVKVVENKFPHGLKCVQ